MSSASQTLKRNMTLQLSARLSIPLSHLDQVLISHCAGDDCFTYPLTGARFGPRAIRQASSRQTSLRAFNPRANINPYQNWAKIIDCGDIPITPFDNNIATEQMTQAFRNLGRAKPISSLSKGRPKLITLGGDHSLALPALRSLKEIYGKPVRVLHFDGMSSR